MPSGTVKCNPTKGYGFIQPNGATKDVVVHISTSSITRPAGVSVVPSRSW